MFEILKEKQYDEYEAYVSSHPRGEFTQSIYWKDVKANWQFEAVVSRDDNGKIRGACAVLVQKISFLCSSFMYCPRGPICDIHDKVALKELKDGIDAVAKKHRAHVVKMDPDVLISDNEFINFMKSCGFKQIYGPLGFETIQARFNYRLPLKGKTEDEVLMGLTQKTRYNVRYAIKNGVTIEVKGIEALDEFMPIYKITGERDGFNIRSKQYFANFLQSLGEHARLYMGYYNGVPVCGAVTVNYAGKCCYIYGASDNEHRKIMANYLMQWEMIKWGIETGCELYDFQGISGDIDNEQGSMYGLYRFKRGFSGRIDELVGELDYVYKPLTNKIFNFAVDFRAKFMSKH